MKTEELQERIRNLPLDFVLWLFRPPGFFSTLWMLFLYEGLSSYNDGAVGDDIN